MVCVQTEDGAIRAEAGVHLDPDARAAVGDGLPPRFPHQCRPTRWHRARHRERTGRDRLATARMTSRLGVVGQATSLRCCRHWGSAAWRSSLCVSRGRSGRRSCSAPPPVSRFTGSGRMVIEDLARRIRLALVRIRLYQEVQDANRLKDEFLSTLSHELRTPFSVVFGWTRILRMRPLDAGTAHAVEVIERNAKAQLRLIEDVLDVSRIIAGKMALSMEPLSIRGCSRRDDRRGTSGGAAKSVRLETHLDQDVAVVVPTRTAWSRRSRTCSPTRSSSRGPATDYCQSAQRQRLGRDSRGRHRRRDSTGRAAVRVRSLPSGRLLDDAPPRRAGSRPQHRPADRRAPRRNSDGEQPGGGPGRDVHDPAAARSRLRALRRRARRRRAVCAPAAGTVDALHGRKVLVVEDHDDARELVASVIGAAGAEVTSATSTAEALDMSGRDNARSAGGGSGSSRRRRLHAPAANSSDEDAVDRTHCPPSR